MVNLAGRILLYDPLKFEAVPRDVKMVSRPRRKHSRDMINTVLTSSSLSVLQVSYRSSFSPPINGPRASRFA